MLSFACIRCMHCSKPPCLDACPTKAIYKEADGIVLVNRDLCIGCKMCVEVCPFRVIQFNLQDNIVEKCTLCVHRVREGLKPSCVLACPTKALMFGEANEILNLKQEQSLRKLYPTR
ncbi:MAG: 4Fe-4S dicluster domain-containing protein [Candidatus Bathyarchaeia archaeon]